MSRLFLLGDGEILDLVAELAGRLDYETIVRGDDLPEALDGADQVVIECADPRRGRELVAEVLALGEPGYLGICAAEKDALVTLLKLAADRVPRIRLERIAAPAGLPIKASTPDEWAIAIVAQLIAERRGGAASGSPPRD